MALTLTHAAAAVAGLAIIASYLGISRKGLLARVAAAVGLGIFAAVLLHVIA